jgi:hypothetical protein
MTKRSLLIVLLLVVFLLSAWGNVIGAAFCPRYLAQNCFAHRTHQSTQIKPESCHHEMTDMDMGDMQMDEEVAAEPVSSGRENPTIEVAAESSVERAALDVQTQPCGHCWMHSQPSSGTGTLAAVDPSPRSVEALAPPTEIAIDLPFPQPIATEPLDHSPPGSSFPRHILINVFRI